MKIFKTVPVPTGPKAHAPRGCWFWLALLWLIPAPAKAQSYQILHHFGTNVMGVSPLARLVQGADGTLYGTTGNGGTLDQGQVFKVNPDGSGYAALVNFTGANGSGPCGSLVLAGSTLYGTTDGGGSANNGTVFRINTDGTGFSVLADFPDYYADGAYPNAGLVLAGTNLYGVAANGGSADDGTVFRVSTDGAGFTVLKEFTGNDGANPMGDLALSGSTLYGTTWAGGPAGLGTVFKLNSDGTVFSVLADFANWTNGVAPCAGLVLAGTTLYGTACGGGDSGNGTVFKLNTDGTGLSILAGFLDYTNGASLFGGLALSGTTLYGTASNGGSSGSGTIFKVNTDGTGFTVLRDLIESDGAAPWGALIVSNTTLYGTARWGGSNSYGAVFRLETDGSNYRQVLAFQGGDGRSPLKLFLSGGTLYGTTGVGGGSDNGTIFKLNTDGSAYAMLKTFAGSDGSGPSGDLGLANSLLYGTTVGGGLSNCGTVFQLNTDTTNFAVLKHFTGPDGCAPMGGVLLAGTNLYGTTAFGSSSQRGTVFQMDADGTGFTTLKEFTEGIDPGWPWPYGGLALEGTTLYGTSTQGGALGNGSVFKINTDGSGYAVLKSFSYYEGQMPGGTPLLSDNVLYGTTMQGGTYERGTVFKLNTDGTGFAKLKEFVWGSLDGCSPSGPLLLSGTNLYGTTTSGGALGYGTVFRVGTDGSGFQVLKYFVGNDGAYPRDLALEGTTLYGVAMAGGAVDRGVVFSLSLLPGAPVLAWGPQSQTANFGSTVDLAVAATGIPAPVYQWFFQGALVPGATSAVLELTNVSQAQAGSYSVIVSNNYGSVTSAIAVLSVSEPIITNQSLDQSWRAGDTAWLSVSALGTAPLSYQWFKDGTALNDGGNILGAHAASLTISNLQVANAGGYLVVVTNSYGTATSQVAMLTVEDPFILAPPLSQTVSPGQTAMFTVVPGGTAPFGYQWRKAGLPLTGQTAAQLLLTNAQFTDAGSYDVVATNVYGGATSQVAVLRVSIATADSFNPAADNQVRCLAVQPNGKILVGGLFTSVGGQARAGLARLTAAGDLDGAFNPGVGGGGYVNTVVLQPDGRILVGGRFDVLAGWNRSCLGRLNPDGALDVTCSPPHLNNVWGSPYLTCLVVQPDGRIVIGGQFNGLGNDSRCCLARLNSDGSLDTTFQADAPVNWSYVATILVQPDGKLLVGGLFASLAGQPRSNIARLSADGTVDAAFNPGANQTVYCMAIQPDGKILVGGDFTTLAGQDCNRLGRLNPDGTWDATFSAANSGPTEGYLSSILLQPDGRVLVGGTFSLLDGQRRDHLGRFNPDGTLEPTFDPGADYGVQCLALQTPDQLLAGGDFSILGGQPRNRLGRLTLLDLPRLVLAPATQTAEAGSTVDLTARAIGNPAPAYQWLYDGATALAGATNTLLRLAPVQPSDAGAYSVVVTNLVGAVTSPPATLSIIPPVPRRTVPALTLRGMPGDVVTVEFTAGFNPEPGWASLDTVALTTFTQWYFDPTVPLPSRRFYRLQQAGLAPPSVLALHLVPALTLSGSIGNSLRIDAINQFGPVDAWTNLATVALTNSPQLYFDISSIGQPPRLYRIVPAP